jgi:pimeloyl-ACP methyl ester carboxylesterase
MLHTYSKGTGFPAVFIHGFCEDGQIWAPVLEGLGCRAICVDLPGFGRSPLPPSPPSIDDYAQAVSETLDAMGIGECIMFGHSLGGYVALAFARLHPHRLKGLGMVHSTVFADDEAKQENRLKVAQFVREHGAKPFLSGFYPNLFAPGNKTKFAAEIAQLSQSEVNPEAIALAALAMRGRPDSSDTLRALHVPVLYLIGKQDQAVPFEKSMEQCGIPKDAIVHIWEEVGHIGMLEAPEAMRKALAAFVGYCIS